MTSIKLPRATLEQKIQILDFYHALNRPQLETVDRYKNELSISTSSFSEWLKNEDELRSRLNEADSNFAKNSRRKVKFKYEKINKAMDILVQKKLENGEAINEPTLREHWSIYAHQFGVEDPKRLVGFSHGWLSQFKKRHGLTKQRMARRDSPSATDTRNKEYDYNGNGDMSTDESRASTNQSLLTNPTTTTEPTSNPPTATTNPATRRKDDLNYEFPSNFRYNNQMSFNYPMTLPNFDYTEQFRPQYNKQRQDTQAVARAQVQQVHSQPAQVQPHAQLIPQPLTKPAPSVDKSHPPNISANDIERFIYMFADKFFRDNNYEYPQTVKIFQEFKNSFFNERMLNSKPTNYRSAQMGNIDDFFMRGNDDRRK